MGFSKRITWVEAAANWHIVYWKHSGVVSREAPACLNSFMQAAGWGRHRVWNCRLTLIDSGCHFAMMWRCGQRLGCFFFPPLLTLKTVKKLSTILHQWLYYTVLNQLEREREREKQNKKQVAGFVRSTEIKCHGAAGAIRYDVTATVAVSQDVVGW